MMSVVQKLLSVMHAVTALQKDGHNSGQNYTYLSEEKVTTTLHDAFTKAGLTMRPLAMEILSEYEYPTAKSVAHGRVIRVTYELRDGEDSLIVQTIGEGADSGDKATNKAMSAALKYALRQTCLISTGDDPDRASPEAIGASERVSEKLAPTCGTCGEPITPSLVNGRAYTVSQLLVISNKRCGKPTCAACMQQMVKAKPKGDGEGGQQPALVSEGGAE